MPEQLLFGHAARRRMLSGIEVVARAVSPTLGPGGRNVAVDGRRMAATQRYGPPDVNAQAQAIIRDLELSDRMANMGSELVRQAARRTDELVGDGTATTVVLAAAMVREGLKCVVAGANAMLLCRGIKRASQAVSSAILAMADAEITTDTVRRIIRGASRSDDIAEAILWAMERVGPDGMVMVERSPETVGIVVDCDEGFQYDRGLISAYFCADAHEDAVTLSEPAILLTDQKVEAAEQLLPLMRQLCDGRKEASLLVVAPEVSGGALALLVANQRQGALHCAAVRPPSYGVQRQGMLADLAVYTGATILSESMGHPLETATLADLGRCQEAYISLTEAILYDGAGTPAAVSGRIRELRQLLQSEIDPYEVGKLERRIAQLGGGLATLEVGGVTEAEMDNRVELVENALTSLRAMMAEGVVPGGGVAYLLAAQAAEGLGMEGSEAMGASAVQRALEAPLRCIAANCGARGSSVVAEWWQRRLTHPDETPCYDAVRGVFGSQRDTAILDPCRTVRLALANATSCAAMALTTETLVRTTPPPLSSASRRAAQRHLQEMSGRLMPESQVV